MKSIRREENNRCSKRFYEGHGFGQTFNSVLEPRRSILFQRTLFILSKVNFFCLGSYSEKGYDNRSTPKKRETTCEWTFSFHIEVIFVDFTQSRQGFYGISYSLIQYCLNDLFICKRNFVNTYPLLGGNEGWYRKLLLFAFFGLFGENKIKELL